MNFKRETVINRPVAEVWEVLGNQFGEAYKWASSLRHSESFGKPTMEGASCSNRACNTTQGKIIEVVRVFDARQHTLQYEVLEGFPFFIDTGVNTWQLTAQGDKTHLSMNADITTKGFVGAIMNPMMKMQMNTLFDEAVEDFKYYVEHDGEPHPRKVKANRKLAKKAA
ncbi:SRPBCC family protein [Tunicatimonas pelagia]|uniref:SRPBCC family protein n=1 Tax=Tunicatimonas pelagia TaxID=931531 RepID=UPI002665F516|nr:SRPBCC family protein [Tunicatimonas pelagia]WKN44743.1 SRPBCC family protein [Tunicatimonas pelagia]